MRVPPPLTEGKLCPDCKGTGADIVKTEKAAKTSSGPEYYMCWSCNGNGLDPAEYFRWSTKETNANLPSPP